VSDSSDVWREEWRTPEPPDLIFPKWQSELFKTITRRRIFDRTEAADHVRIQPTAHVYQHAVDGGANIYQIAKNCRTSVGMIEKYYGVHIKNSLNAAAINVVRSNKDVMAEEEVCALTVFLPKIMLSLPTEPDIPPGAGLAEDSVNDSNIREVLNGVLIAFRLNVGGP
jgi:hypothetical protein